MILVYFFCLISGRWPYSHINLDINEAIRNVPRHFSSFFFPIYLGLHPSYASLACKT